MFLGGSLAAGSADAYSDIDLRVVVTTDRHGYYVDPGDSEAMARLSPRPLSDLLFELHARFGQPLLISETGTEDDARAPWLRVVATEVARARCRGVPVEAIYLYPIADHLGWDDDRLCHNGLLSHDLHQGTRLIDGSLLATIQEAATPGRMSPG